MRHIEEVDHLQDEVNSLYQRCSESEQLKSGLQTELYALTAALETQQLDAEALIEAKEQLQSRHLLLETEYRDQHDSLNTLKSTNAQVSFLVVLNLTVDFLIMFSQPQNEEKLKTLLETAAQEKKRADLAEAQCSALEKDVGLCSD